MIPPLLRITVEEKDWEDSVYQTKAWEDSIEIVRWEHNYENKKYIIDYRTKIS